MSDTTHHDLMTRLDQALHFEDWMPVPDNFSEAVPLLRESRNRIEELEAKLAKAVEALRGWIDFANAEGMPVLLSDLEAAELKGQGDE